jgi:uncharacterized damage-inducible protein DinB
MGSYGAKELARSFRTVRNNTVQIAEDIPESKYGYVAAPGTRSVGELLKHIHFAPALFEDMHAVKKLTTLQGYDFGAFVARSAAAEKAAKTKAEIVAMLKADGEKFAAWLETLSPAFLAETYTDPSGQNPKSRLESLHSPKEHEMHHRGQLMLIERLIGVVPHLTRQMEERMKGHAAAAAAPATAAPTWASRRSRIPS